MNEIIFFDVETSGLPIPGERDLNKQPRIVEIAAIKVDAGLNEVARFETFINPGIPIPPETIRIHGITDDMVREAPSFPAALAQFIRPFWLGVETVCAYNAAFDLELLRLELARIGHEFRFPWCWDVVDPIQYRGSKRLSLELWSKEVYGDAYVKQTHRAMGDVERLLHCYRKTYGEVTT